MKAGSRRCAFTLVEMLVSVAVLLLIMVIISQLFNSASAVTGMRNKQMDADTQAREVFDRMAIDFAQMVKRPDVDYFLKSSMADQNGNSQPQSGSSAISGSNDQLAFYAQVPGYYPTTTSAVAQSPFSLVAYRVNTDSNTSPNPNINKLQRLGYGLVWSGVSGTGPAMIYSAAPTSCIPNTISTRWPAATSMAADPNYELAGPQVFRMEYYYVLKGQTVAGVPYPSILSDTPWDGRIPGHTSVSGLQDVAAIGVVIAVVDPKSLLLVSNSQLTTLAGNMQDFPATDASGNNPEKSGDLEAQWQSAINTTAGIPRLAAMAIRVYGRTFYLRSN